LGLKPEEVDCMEGTLVDAFMIALIEVNKDGGGGKKEMGEVERQFLGR